MKIELDFSEDDLKMIARFLSMRGKMNIELGYRVSDKIMAAIQLHKDKNPMVCDFTIDFFQKEAHRIAVEHGFWETERNVGEQIALMHSELSEMLEAFRKDPDAPSEHVPEITCVAEEMADVVIGVMDTAEKYGIDLEQAIRLKTKFNDGRPYKNGKKF